MNWNITSSGILTGLTPWIVNNNKNYYSYFLTEKMIDWESELKYPLIQTYLAESIIECDVTEINVGIYCLSTDSFSFKNFSKDELGNAIEETIEIFEKADKAYRKIKV